jgi:hypothetical protein
MAIQWEKGSDKEHQSLARKTSTSKDPVWDQIMAEIATGNVVKVKYSDEKERGTLARSIGRRAAHMGFKVDQRRGEGFISVQRIPEAAS